MHGGFEGGVLDLVLKAGPVAQVILLVLLAFSVVSWGIIAEKWMTLRRARRESEEFLRLFNGTNDLSEVFRNCRNLKESPVCAVFREGFEVLRRARPGGGYSSGGLLEGGVNEKGHLEATLEVAASAEVSKLERYLTFLATTGSVSPFFGLFGTVWGIMDSFLSIGQRGSANISVVAPGIAEALVATAAGLGAAIPAVIGYNYFLGRIEAVRVQLERFGVGFLDAVEQGSKVVQRAERGRG